MVCFVVVFLIECSVVVVILGVLCIWSREQGLAKFTLNRRRAMPAFEVGHLDRVEWFVLHCTINNKFKTFLNKMLMKRPR